MIEENKERYRRIRGAILKLLAHQHPGPLHIREIHFLLDDLRFTISSHELDSHVSYLEEKGFVISEERKSGGLEARMIRITANGLNILDQFNDDVGIDTRF
jgi:DNA-binding PadR family transcriptional regulator